ncbi:MAG: HD-GYP domain-containing protein [Candidatus Omnitrophica bacterium]|nr:HD-GYP domain-containing protein [Candidatus Omnitrophota bacterium]
MGIMLERISESDLDTLAAAIETKDIYSRGHSEKVTRYAIEIANAMRLSFSDQLILSYAGRLHDIGKITISDQILNKKGPLTPREWVEMKKHSIRGAEMLSNFMFAQGCIPIVRHHHERYDGKGYPDGLKGEEIPFLARILACADAFDAMISARAYKPKMSFENAIKELKANRGTQFDPNIVDVFIEVLSPAKTARRIS